MTGYETFIRTELEDWQKKMLRKPGLLNNLSKRLQVKINSYIPEKVHKAITITIKQMIRGVLFGAKFTTTKKYHNPDLGSTEIAVRSK